MRKETIDGKEWEIKGLKRKDVKALKKSGINLMSLDHEKADDAMDAVFDMVFTPEQVAEIDEMGQADAMKLWKEVLKETFGAPDEEKN